MDPILIFVVLPLATIIFSIALQRLLKCPILVAGIVFAVFLILTYTVFGTDFLIAAIVYAILAFITAFLVSLFCKIIRRLQNLERRNSDCDCDCENDEDCASGSGNSNRPRSRRRRCDCDCDDGDDSDDNLLTISSKCGNGRSAELLTISTGGMCGNNNNSNNSNCNCNSNNCSYDNANNSNNNETIVVNAEVVPSINGRSGCFRGGFRRRCN